MTAGPYTGAGSSRAARGGGLTSLGFEGASPLMTGGGGRRGRLAAGSADASGNMTVSRFGDASVGDRSTTRAVVAFTSAPQKGHLSSVVRM